MVASMNRKWKQQIAWGLSAAMLLLCMPAAAADEIPETEKAVLADSAEQTPTLLPGETAGTDMAVPAGPQDLQQPVGEPAYTGTPGAGNTEEKPPVQGPVREQEAVQETLEPAEEIAAEEVVPAASPVMDEELDTVVRDFVDTKSITGISDEEFYGVYDPETETWTQEGYFNWEAHPEMDSVKEEVMRAGGDYTQVKEELLEYYRAKRETQNIGLPGEPNAQAVFFGYALEHNMYFHPTWKMLGNAFVNGQDQYISFDVSQLWSEIAASEDKLVSFVLMAYRKDGNEAVFSSREAGANPPILEVEANGVVTTLTPAADATVMAGSHAKENFGGETTLRVEESATSIGGSQPTDSNTKRSHIKFDLSELSLDSTITRATLKVYGRNAGGNDQKEIFAFKVPTNTWTEDKISFEKIDGSNNYEQMAYSWDGEESIRYMRPTYSGYRYREEMQRFETWFPLMEKLYVNSPSDNEHYAHLALRHWVGFLKQTGTSARGPKDYFIPLDLGCRAICLPEDFAHWIQSEHMTPEVYSATLKYLWKNVYEMTVNNFLLNDQNNAGIVGARGLHTINCFFNEFRIYERALEKVRTKLDSIAKSSLINDDGSYGEASLAYAGMSTNNTLGYIKPNTMTGNPDLPFRDEDYFDDARKIGLYLINACAPGMRDNQWGDGAAYSSQYISTLTSINKEFDDPYIKYFVTEGKEGMIPPHTSYMYKNTKRTIMRSDWGEDAVYIFSDVDGGTGYHGHKDDNAIILSAYGRNLLSDQLFYSYGTGPIKNYLTSAKAHNTITIDGANQSTTKKGQINHWETNGIYDNTANVTFGSQGSGRNENHTRNILYLRSGFVLVSDYVKPYDSDSGEHVYDQYWHMPPDAKLTLDETSLTARSNVADEANVQVVPVDDGELEAAIENGYYIATTADYAKYQKKGRGPVTFDTVLYPEKPGERPEITAEKLNLSDVEDNGATAMRVVIEPEKGAVSDISYYLVHDTSQQKVRRFGNYETDARCAYVERDGRGNLAQLIIQDGTYIKDLSKDLILFQAREQVSQLGFRAEYGSLALASSQTLDLQKCTVLADTGSAPTELTWNGKKTDYKLSGRYVYFENQPIIDGGELPEPTPGPTAKPGGTGGGTNRPGGGGSGGMGGGSQPAATKQPQPTAEPGETQKPSDEAGHFEDLTGAYAWAEPYAEKLYAAGVVNGVQEGIFEPARPVTREELVKMAVLAAGLAPEPEGSLPFSDIAADDWMYPYIAAAVRAGMVTGITETVFGAGQAVTRQDLAVICARALRLRGPELEPNSPDQAFADETQIADYALDSVKLLQAMGIAGGDENGNFRPNDAASRAECAKIICGVLTK